MGDRNQSLEHHLVIQGGVIALSLAFTTSALASDFPSVESCNTLKQQNSSVITDRWNVVQDLDSCLEEFSQRSGSRPSVEALQQQLEEDTQELQSSSDNLQPLEASLDTLEQQQFSPTTKLTGLTVLGVQYGDSIGDRPFIRPLTGQALKDSRPSSIGISFFTLNTSLDGNDLLKATLYTSNFTEELLSRAQIGNSDTTNSVDTFFIPSRMVWSRVPRQLTLYRLSYQFKPASDLTVTVGPKFFPTDIIDKNSYTNPITTFNSWSMIGNSLITPYQMRLIGGAGAGVDWNIDGGPLSLRGVYIARQATVATSETEDGGLFNAPYQGSVELEYRDKLGPQNHLAVRLQYSNSDTSNIQQNVVGLNAEVGLGKVGLFGRFGHSWSNADPEINPLPFSPGDAGRFQTTQLQAGVAVKDVGLERSLLAVAVGQPFRTTLDPEPGIPKEFQTNIEAFYRIPLSNNLYLAPTLITVLNPNNRGDQPTLMQGFLRFTLLY